MVGADDDALVVFGEAEGDRESIIQPACGQFDKVPILKLEHVNVFVTAADGYKRTVVAEAAVCERLVATLVVSRYDLLPVLPDDKTAVDCPCGHDETTFL